MILRRPKRREEICLTNRDVRKERRPTFNTMNRIFTFFFLQFVLVCAVRAQLITSIPGPDDQGGMLMPMISISASAGTGSNPTAGALAVSFTPSSVPTLQSLQQWSPGSWFADTAAWRGDLGSPAGVGGTPAGNAGSGDLFNNQYGFTFMGNGSMMMAFVPTGKSLGIKMLSFSSPLLESYNYVNAQNRWDRIFDPAGSQVLWNGSMWHNYFALPGTAPAGTYTASFEVFVANQAFTTGTGFADYTAGALSAAKDANFTPATVNYTWTVVPEPHTGLLLALAGVCLGGLRWMARKRTP